MRPQRKARIVSPTQSLTDFSLHKNQNIKTSEKKDQNINPRGNPGFKVILRVEI